MTPGPTGAALIPQVERRQKKPRHHCRGFFISADQLTDQDGTATACPLIARSTSSRLATAYIA